MTKKLVDANVILRYLLRDDETLFQKASEFLDKVRIGKEKTVILESVLAECVYVLLKIYGVDRSTVGDKLGGLLLYKGVANTDKKDLIDSLNLFAQTRLSFVDCLLCAKAKNNAMPLVTFDAELTNISSR